MVICVVPMILPWCCAISDDMFVIFSSFLAILQQLSIIFSLCFCLCNLFYLKYGILKVLAAYCMLLSTTEFSMFLQFSMPFPNGLSIFVAVGPPFSWWFVRCPWSFHGVAQFRTICLYHLPFFAVLLLVFVPVCLLFPGNILVKVTVRDWMIWTDFENEA